MSGGPTIGDAASFTPQYFDAQVLSASGATVASDTTPGRTDQKFWRGVLATGAGNIKVDTLGVGGNSPSVGIVIAVLAGALLQLCITKVYTSGSTVTGVTAFY